jgi:hypothetical protein
MKHLWKCNHPWNHQEIFSQYINNDDSEPQGSYRLPQHNLRTHPNEYLPTYHLNDESRDDYSDNENFPDPPEEFRGGENCVSQLSGDDLGIIIVNILRKYFLIIRWI